MTAGGHRLPRGGRIDRSQPLSFQFDSARYQAYAGDTIASALIASGVSLVGRSFKYHRPRGFMSAGVEEANGLVTIGTGARHEPNIPATTATVHENLVAASQNRWPSLKYDVGAMNSLAAPFLPAGFYYKTFMGPGRGTRAWMFYEKIIRSAAGLGAPSDEPDADRYEHGHLFCDVLVIGSGPAGLSAALAAGRAGARVILAEQDFAVGGSLLSEASEGPAADWLSEVLSELASLPNVSIMARTTAFGLYDSNVVGLVERRDDRLQDPDQGEARQIFHIARARSIVMACGAIERPLVFSNNDRPGVMLASAARTYLNRYAVAPGRRIVVATNNDSAYAAAIDLAAAGAEVTLTDLRMRIPPELRQRAIDGGVDVRIGFAVIDIAGKLGVSGATLAELDWDESIPEVAVETRPCDLVCYSGGWSPSVHLTSHLGVKPAYNASICAFVPGGFALGHFGAGAMMGDLTTAGAIAQGWKSGCDAAAHAGITGNSGERPDNPETGCGEDPATHAVWEVKSHRKGKAFLDFQNDVSTRDIRLAHREGYVSVEHMKRYTTLGMATDQGKTSNINALAIMAGLRGIEPGEAGTTTFRPPYTPIALGALAGRSIGHHFRPTRRTPMHEWHIASGAQMTEAGLWMRPWYYKSAGKDVNEAYVNEMRYVREGVGIADVSTLGKIDVQGPDAAEFLNRVYVNGFAKLPVGKARYGAMLHDDGLVLDDGTTTRLAENRFFMTTTTAQAAEVMSWLEYLLQTAWPDLRVSVASITDEWAGMSMAGPKARAVLSAAFPDQDFSDAAIPHMGAFEFFSGSAAIRVLRLSFSGELAYEIYCPAGYGYAVWEHMLNAGKAFGIRPYGLEALAALRIEKGHVAGLDLDHRVTLADIGLGRMANRRKAFVGDKLSERPNYVAEDRRTLVGIECIEDGGRLRGGSILFDASDEIKGHGRGHISSVTYSPDLGKYIALGFFEGGPASIGREIIAAYPLRKEQVRARIVSPHFVDPRGDRLNV